MKKLLLLLAAFIVCASGIWGGSGNSIFSETTENKTIELRADTDTTYLVIKLADGRTISIDESYTCRVQISAVTGKPVFVISKPGVAAFEVTLEEWQAAVVSFSPTPVGTVWNPKVDYGIDLQLTQAYGGASYAFYEKEIVAVVYKDKGIKYFLVSDNTVINLAWNQIHSNWQSLSGGNAFKFTYTYSFLGPGFPAVVFYTAKNPGHWTFDWLTIVSGQGYYLQNIWDYNGNTPLINTSFTQNSDGSVTISYRNSNNVQRTIIAKDW